MSAPASSDASAAFDLLDPAVQAEPFAHYARLREHAPVHRAPFRKGQHVHVLSRHDDVQAALKDHETFSSAVAPAPILMFKDPPEHTRLRKTLQRAFTPRAIDALAPRVTALATELWDAYLTAGGGDVVDAFAHPLPALVIGEMLGVPSDRQHELRRWSDDTIRSLGGGVGLDEAARKAARDGSLQLFVLLQSVLDAQRAAPGDSIGGELARLMNEGALTPEEAPFFCQFLFVAGHETTMSLLASGAEVLARQPALRERLRREPALVPRFVEEVLRWKPSLHRLFRVTTREVTIRGVAIPAGAPVVLLLGAANRDAARFPQGETLDVDADASGQLAFGSGIHVCLGAALARLEGRIAFEVMTSRTARLTLDDSRPPVPITGGTTSEFGWRELHLHAAKE